MPHTVRGRGDRPGGAAPDTRLDPRTRAERVLAELLPMDAERQAENEVWLAFTARTLVDSELRSLSDEGYELLREGCRRLVRDLAGDGPSATAVAGEADRLHALVDGLAVHAATRPEHNTPRRMPRHLATSPPRHLAISPRSRPRSVPDRVSRWATGCGG
ncbi:TetR family transcriptional regulator C-terminal domain-containing protein [Streptomyces sp. NPDC005336]|uniref:TetR family transcriptional regulator C-terminal domain-containing protein n=1 Tax=Streptomyces sp. NPDC005336 TaxID=3157035 RepID=UPI0033AAE283